MDKSVGTRPVDKGEFFRFLYEEKGMNQYEIAELDGCAQATVSRKMPDDIDTGPTSIRGPLAERLWSRVDKGDEDECWEWQGATYSNGYGEIGDGKKKRSVHRVAWELSTGQKIPNGKIVRHTCDNRPCVNPNHLKIGTRKDNMQDALRRGRIPTGSGRFNTKVSNDEVADARRRYANEDVTYFELADEYGVSDRTVGEWIRGEKRERADGPILGKDYESSRTPGDVVRLIRREYASGEHNQYDLSDKYDIPRVTISDWTRGKSRLGAGGPIQGEDYEEPGDWSR